MNEGFRGLEIWKEGKSIAVDTYRATHQLQDLGLRDQLRRAAISVPSNIAEGDERSSDKDSVRFFFIAKGSLAELRTQLEISVEVGLLDQTVAYPIIKRATTLSSRIGAIIHHR